MAMDRQGGVGRIARGDGSSKVGCWDDAHHRASRSLPPAKRWPIARLVTGIVLGVALGLVSGISYEQKFFRPEPPSFQRLTFRRGDVTSAKFAPGETVVYSAEWDGGPSTLFSAQPGNREARPLQLPSARVLAISQGGEMAILLGGGGRRNPGARALRRRSAQRNPGGSEWRGLGFRWGVASRGANSWRTSSSWNIPWGQYCTRLRKRPPMMMPRVSAGRKSGCVFRF